MSDLSSYFDGDLAEIIERSDVRVFLDRLLDGLEAGTVRAAEPGEDPAGPWRANPWVKRGILAAFRVGVLTSMDNLGGQSAFDKDTLPLQRLTLEKGVRLVPGGTSIRRGCHVARGVTLMPPAYVNVGAHVETGTMVDSHALVGSCAQIGKNVHLSAAAQVGGVLEPVGAAPVVVGDGAFVGALCGLFEGVQVGAGALLAAGVILTRSTPIADLVEGRWIQAGDSGVLRVPPGAIVVPGARPARGEFARANGISVKTPVLIRYRDLDRDPVLLMEEALRT